MKIPNQRELFDIPENITYLNCAFMSPMMKQIIEVGEEGLRKKSHPWEIFPRDLCRLGWLMKPPQKTNRKNALAVCKQLKSTTGNF